MSGGDVSTGPTNPEPRYHKNCPVRHQPSQRPRHDPAQAVLLLSAGGWDSQILRAFEVVSRRDHELVLVVGNALESPLIRLAQRSVKTQTFVASFPELAPDQLTVTRYQEVQPYYPRDLMRHEAKPHFPSHVAQLVAANYGDICLLRAGQPVEWDGL